MQYVDLHLWLVHDILMKRGIRWAWRILWKSECRFLTGMFWNLRESLPLQYKVQAPRTKVALGQRRDAVSETRRQRKKTWFSDPDSGLAERGKIL